MRRLTSALITLCLALPGLLSAKVVLAQETGTLVVRVKNYTSDTKLPKNVQKTMEHGGMPWGIFESSLVISMVRQNFVKAELQHLTRYGEETSVDIKPGTYNITCIGYDFASTWSLDVDKNLDKSAFINEGVLAFTVVPGKTTTVELTPLIKAKTSWVRLSQVKTFSPEITVRVLQEGSSPRDGIVISTRTDRSVPWNDYQGPLKF